MERRGQNSTQLMLSPLSLRAAHCIMSEYSISQHVCFHVQVQMPNSVRNEACQSVCIIEYKHSVIPLLTDANMRSTHGTTKGTCSFCALTHTHRYTDGSQLLTAKCRCYCQDKVNEKQENTEA